MSADKDRKKRRIPDVKSYHVTQIVKDTLAERKSALSEGFATETKTGEAVIFVLPKTLRKP